MWIADIEFQKWHLQSVSSARGTTASPIDIGFNTISSELRPFFGSSHQSQQRQQHQFNQQLFNLLLHAGVVHKFPIVLNVYKTFLWFPLCVICSFYVQLLTLFAFFVCISTMSCSVCTWNTSRDKNFSLDKLDSHWSATHLISDHTLRSSLHNLTIYGQPSHWSTFEAKLNSEREKNTHDSVRRCTSNGFQTRT